MTIPFGGYRTRSVRLILLERIHGTPLSVLESQLIQLPLEQRQAILSGIIDAESMLFHHKVIHEDLASRNVMLSGTPGTADFRVVILDFGQARWRREDMIEEGVNYVTSGPLSPILRWPRLSPLAYTYQWCDWVDWDIVDWLERTYRGSVLYAPITLEMEELWLPPPDEISRCDFPEDCGLLDELFDD